MKFVLCLLITASLLGCATAPAPSAQVISPETLPWSAPLAESIKSQLCHTQLTDLSEAIGSARIDKAQMTRAQKKTVYDFRMSLRQKISDWTSQDPELSADCILLSSQIQQKLISMEENIVQWVYKNKKTVSVEQNVFMNSDEQLLSNPYAGNGTPITSLSDLKSGDLVLTSKAIEGQESISWSMIYKTDSGSVFSLIPAHSTKWLRQSVHHPLSWLKQPADKVIIFRPLNEQKAQGALERILSRITQDDSAFHQQRSPASSTEAISTLFPSKAAVDPATDPQFLLILEWQNLTK